MYLLMDCLRNMLMVLMARKLSCIWIRESDRVNSQPLNMSLQIYLNTILCLTLPSTKSQIFFLKSLEEMI